MTFDPAAVASGLRPLAYLATVVARPAKAKTALAWTAGRPLYRNTRNMIKSSIQVFNVAVYKTIYNVLK